MLNDMAESSGDCLHVGDDASQKSGIGSWGRSSPSRLGSPSAPSVPVPSTHFVGGMLEASQNRSPHASKVGTVSSTTTDVASRRTGLYYSCSHSKGQLEREFLEIVEPSLVVASGP